MEVTGKILKVGETQEFGSSGFKKRELVLETIEDYPQKLSLEFVQDKTQILSKFKVGQEVVVGINLRGREWTSPEGEVKYFNTIQGWKINLAEGNTQASPVEAEQEDLPF